MKRGERLMSEVWCERCGKLSTGVDSWQDPGNAKLLVVRAWCHGESETARVVEREVPWATRVEGRAFGSGPDGQPGPGNLLQETIRIVVRDLSASASASAASVTSEPVEVPGPVVMVMGGELRGKCPSDQSLTGMHCFGQWVRGVPVDHYRVPSTCKFCGVPEVNLENEQEVTS
jgi:hypothetical protein